MLYSIRLETEDCDIAFVAFVKQRTLKGYVFDHFFLEVRNGKEVEVWDNENFTLEFFKHLKKDSFDEFQQFLNSDPDREDALYSPSYYWKNREELLKIYDEAKEIGVFYGRV